MGFARILLIEDDLALSEQLSALLREHGFVMKHCRDGQQGLLTAMNGAYDLILLDVLLPTLDGFTVLNRLRKARQTPVMMLTACGAEEERIEGFNKGADDYLPKPFNFTELVLRIEALLRRVRRPVVTPSTSESISSGDLLLNRSSNQTFFGGQEIELTPIQFRLLWVLVEHQGEVLNKPFLYQAVLERAFSRYDRTLDMHLSRVRRKLIDAGMKAERFVTVHGKGYRFA